MATTKQKESEDGAQPTNALPRIEPREQHHVRSGSFDLVKIWLQVRSGSLRLGHFVKDGDAYTALVWPHSTPPDERLLKALTVLESAIVLGQKVTALNHSLAISTIASLSAHALKELGVDSTVSRVPLLIALPIFGAHFSMSIQVDVQTWPGNTRLRLVGVDASLRSMLPEAQYEVARGLLDGLDYEEIARSRGVSQRTIANQVVSLFRQLNVSSRAGLLWVVARALASGTLPSKPQATSLATTADTRELSSEVSELRKRVQMLEAELEALKSRFSK